MMIVAFLGVTPCGLVGTDVSEGHVYALKIKAVWFSGTVPGWKFTRWHNPGDHHRHLHSHQNLPNVLMLQCCSVTVITVIIIILLSQVVLLFLSQWWTPPYKLQISDCSTFLMVCPFWYGCFFPFFLFFSFADNLLNAVLVLFPDCFNPLPAIPLAPLITDYYYCYYYY
jgi:hypothetical protein